MVIKHVSLKIWEKNHESVRTYQGEVSSRHIKVSFKNQDQSNLILSNKSVTFYAVKPDGTQLFNTCNVDEETNTVSFMLTSQILSTAGVLKCEFHIFNADNELLKVNGLKIIVSSENDFSNSIESTSEFNTLIAAINEAQCFSEDVGNVSNLTTTEKNTLVGAVNEINAKTLPLSQGGTGATTATDARTNLSVMKETVLYSNSSGTQSTITLSDDYQNYHMIRVYHGINDIYQTSEFYPSQGSQAGLMSSYANASSTLCYFRNGILTFSGNTATFSKMTYMTISAGSVTVTGDTAGKVYKIFGYSY